MVSLASTHRYYALVAAVAVVAAFFALSAVSTVAAVAVVATAMAVPVHYQLQSDQIGFLLLTSCQVDLVLVSYQQGMMAGLYKKGLCPLLFANWQELLLHLSQWGWVALDPPSLQS